MPVRIRESGDPQVDPPVLICLLGSFRLLRTAQPVEMRSDGKTATFLGTLAVRSGHVVSRDALLLALWPDRSTSLAVQSLNSLVYTLHCLLGHALAGAPPILYKEGSYSLNIGAGVAVDVWRFDALARSGDQQMRAGDRLAAAAAYQGAIQLYRGDLCVSTDVHAVLERERLRARYLSILARLADQRFAESDYEGCLEYALRLLDSEPAREDAHRLAMCCYVRRGERAQAMRQYQLCVGILRREFDTGPEPETSALFERTRLDPASV